MRPFLCAAASVVFAGAALADEPTEVIQDKIWVATVVNDQAFPFRAWAKFEQNEKEELVVSGEAPCNAFNGPFFVGSTMGGAFQAGPLAVTRRACPAMEAEQLFLQVFTEAHGAEIREGKLRLDGEQGTMMIFEAADSPPPRR